ncbi:MAG: hypothetical protein WD534_01885 [Phycisphaeraceae bacterium]
MPVRIIIATALVFLLGGCTHSSHLADLHYLPDTYQPGPLSPALKIDSNWWWYTGSDDKYDWLAFRPEIIGVHSWYQVPRDELVLDHRFPRTLNPQHWVPVGDQIPYNHSSP